MPPTVSINLCCYNSEKYLRETLESVVNQTYQDWELVIINDGSTDSTESIIKEYIELGYPIVYLYHENMGLAYSRNEAINRSQGEYIAFIDHDDLWLLDKLEKQVQILDRNRDIDIVYGKCFKIYAADARRVISSKAKYSKNDFKGYLFPELLNFYNVGILTVILRRRKLLRLDCLFDTKLQLTEDYDLFMRYFYNYNGYFLSDPTAIYRVHQSSSSFRNVKTWINEIQYVIGKLKNMSSGFQQKYSKELKHVESNMAYAVAKTYLTICDMKNARKTIEPWKFTKIQNLFIYISTYLPSKFLTIYLTIKKNFKYRTLKFR